MKADFVIDNMPKNAAPTYECATDATPLVFRPDKNGDCLVKARKDKGTKTRYTIPLYSVTDTILGQVSHVIALMRNNEVWMKNVVMCIQGDKIGLACHDPRLKQQRRGWVPLHSKTRE